MAKRKTHDEYVAELAVKNPGVTVVGEYQGSTKKITHRCMKGHEWEVSPNHALRDRGCNVCSPRKRKSHDDYVAEVVAINSGIEVVGKYVGSKVAISHRCAKGHEWQAKPNSILSGTGCLICAGKKQKTHKEYSAEVEALNTGIVVLGKYSNCHSKITHQCSNGHQWEAVPSNILNGSGCPRCKPGSDADVFYLWVNGKDPSVYKVGITSERRDEGRITDCSRHNNMTPRIIMMLKTPNARDIERRALELGDDPHYPDTIDGYTEFRRYSDAELGEVWRMAVGA